MTPLRPIDPRPPVAPAVVAPAVVAAEAIAEAAAPGDRLERSARIRFAVAQGLAQGRVGFVYQPVVRADAPGFPAFHELLVRLTLPSGEVMPAGVFMPLIEAGTLGRAVDRLALCHAVELLERDPSLRLSVNLSPLSMGDADWHAAFDQARARAPRALGRLILEITESEALRDIEQTRDFMEHVRTAGVAFALDDFGAGATGFRHFRELRFDIVKIDGAYIDGVAGAPDSKILVECLMAVARHFEMMTVAERVERPEDAAWLARLGIDCLQGYLYGRPSPEILSPAPAARADRMAG
jgi:EAL domain-containing protein (putative c-di-GMP-specific phosphodiesterase class I)